MASDVVRDLTNTIMASNIPDSTVLFSSPRTNEPDTAQESQELQPIEQSPSSVFITDDSSGDVEQWFGGDINRTHGLRDFGTVEIAQRPTLPQSSSVDSARFWYVLAMVLPLFRVPGIRGWRCSPSVLFNTVEIFINQVVGFCTHTRSRLRAMSREGAARDVFAGAMDVILLTYAIGFFLLTMYHASVFGRGF